MTITDQRTAAPYPAHHGSKRRRIGVIIAVLVLMVGGSAAAVTLRHLDHHYGPIQGGEFGGPYTRQNWVFSKDGFSESLSPAPGITAKYLASISNLGSHSVKITSIDTTDVVSAISWSVYRYPAGGNATGIHTRWHEFPATVPAHGTVRLLLILRHPDNCSSYLSYRGQKQAYLDGSLEVHWKSLLHRHTTPTDVVLPDTLVGIC